MEPHVGGSNNIILFFNVFWRFIVLYISGMFNTFDYSTFDTFVLSNSNICNKIWCLFLGI